MANEIETLKTKLQTAESDNANLKAQLNGEQKKVELSKIVLDEELANKDKEIDSLVSKRSMHALAAIGLQVDELPKPKVIKKKSTAEALLEYKGFRITTNQQKKV